jgi:hypothetical protein
VAGWGMRTTMSLDHPLCLLRTHLPFCHIKWARSQSDEISVDFVMKVLWR